MTDKQQTVKEIESELVKKYNLDLNKCGFTLSEREGEETYSLEFGYSQTNGEKVGYFAQVKGSLPKEYLYPQMDEMVSHTANKKDSDIFDLHPLTQEEIESMGWELQKSQLQGEHYIRKNNNISNVTTHLSRYYTSKSKDLIYWNIYDILNGKESRNKFSGRINNLEDLKYIQSLLEDLY